MAEWRSIEFSSTRVKQFKKGFNTTVIGLILLIIITDIHLKCYKWGSYEERQTWMTIIIIIIIM